VENYLKDATSDQLFRMIEKLASELWVLRDRLSALEALLDRKGIVVRHEVDTYAPEGNAAVMLGKDRRRLVTQVFGAPFGITEESR